MTLKLLLAEDDVELREVLFEALTFANNFHVQSPSSATHST